MESAGTSEAVISPGALGPVSSDNIRCRWKRSDPDASGGPRDPCPTPWIRAESVGSGAGGPRYDDGYATREVFSGAYRARWTRSCSRAPKALVPVAPSVRFAQVSLLIELPESLRVLPHGLERIVFQDDHVVPPVALTELKDGPRRVQPVHHEHQPALGKPLFQALSEPAERLELAVLFRLFDISGFSSNLPTLWGPGHARGFSLQSG